MSKYVEGEVRACQARDAAALEGWRDGVLGWLGGGEGVDHETLLCRYRRQHPGEWTGVLGRAASPELGWEVTVYRFVPGGHEESVHASATADNVVVALLQVEEDLELEFGVLH